MTGSRTKIFVISLLANIVASTASRAASPTPTTVASPTTTAIPAREVDQPVDSPTATKPGTQLLWDSWYTMTIGGRTAFGYYNDRVENRDGKFAYQNQLWKMEEGFINKERVVSFGTDNADVSPLLFNFVANYRDSEFVIDGTFRGKELSVKSRRGKDNSKPILVNVPSKAFLSTLFQVWIGKRLKEMKPGKRISFTTIFEDALDSRYASVAGSATLEADDAYSKKTNTRRVIVEMANAKTTWYVLPTGEAVRIEKPDQKLVIEKTTEANALSFLVKRSE